MFDKKISWIFDENKNIITSRILYFIDEIRRNINNEKYDCYDDFITAIGILNEVCENPKKIK